MPPTTLHSGSSTEFGTLRVDRCSTTHPVTPVPSGIGFGEDLVDPVADREHRPQQARGLVDLVDRQIVVAQQRAQMVRDPAERPVERVRREDAGSRVDQRFQRRSTFRSRGQGQRSHPLIGRIRVRLDDPYTALPPPE